MPSDNILFYMHWSLVMGVWYILLVVITELYNPNWKGKVRFCSTTALLQVGSTTEHYSGLCPVWFRILSRQVVLQHLWAICSTVLPPSQYIRVQFPIFQFMPITSSPFAGCHWEESDSISKPSCLIFMYIDRVSPEDPLLQAEQSQLSQLFSMSDGPSSNHLLGLLLDLLQCTHVMPFTGEPRTRPSTSGMTLPELIEGQGHLPRVAFGSTLHYTAQDGVGLQDYVSSSSSTYWPSGSPGPCLQSCFLADWPPAYTVALSSFQVLLPKNFIKMCLPIFSTIQVGNSVFCFLEKILKHISKRYALILLWYVCKGLIHSYKRVLPIDEILRWGVWSSSYVPNAVTNKKKTP